MSEDLMESSAVTPVPNCQRIAVLLGAGASRSAGLPLSTELTEQVINRFAANEPELSPVLNYVCSAIIGHAGTLGTNPLEALNIERVVSSIRLLAERGTHEAAPFVNWLPAAEHWDEHVAEGAQQLVTDISSGLVGFADSRFGDHFVSAVRSVMRPGTGEIYRRLEAAVVQTVARILKKHGSVDYLAPLVELAAQQPGGIDVATLNYDLTIESACAQSHLACTRGVVGTAVDDLVWGQDGLRLYKLHGSVDWSRYEVGPNLGIMGEPYERIVSSERIGLTAELPRGGLPAVVLGDRDKLGSGGLTIELISAFQQALSRANRLVVVGYSFADAHVNQLITRWINSNLSRELTILDPGWPARPSEDTYQANLVAGLLRSGSSHRRVFPAPRMTIIIAGAEDGLTRALEQRPRPTRDPDVRVERVDADAIQLRFTNRDLDPIYNLQLRLTARGQELRQSSVYAIVIVGTGGHSRGVVTAEAFRPGAELTIELRLTAEERAAADAFCAHFQADIPGGAHAWTLDVPAAF